MITQFGNYLLDEPLARGGMARVYRARLRGLGGFEKPLVVKQVLPELASDPRFVEMFVREANTLVAMSHPHIVSVYELGVVDGVYFLAMEYVEGATLAEMLRAGGALPPSLCAQLLLQVCDALEYAHDRFGILHRDLSPRNIIVDRSGHARLLDFGISTPVVGAQSAGFGSLGYMAPEQLRGEGGSVQSDLFALGAVLHELLTGTPAFLKGDRAATRRALLEQPPPTLAPGEHPEPLVTLVSRLLAPEPDARPRSAGEVGRALRHYLSQAAPEGAHVQLAARVEQARAERTPLSERPASTSPLTQPGTSAPRTLATHALLDEARRKSGPKPAPTPAPRDDGTRPITGRKRAPTPTPSDDGTRPITGRNPAPAPPPHRAAPVAVAVAVVVAVVVVVVVVASRDPAGQPESSRRTSTPSEAAGGPLEPAPAPTPTPAPAPTPTPTPTPAPAPTPSSTSTASEAALGGSLEVNAIPWAELSLDGRPLGTTPLREHTLPAGKHILTARCPPLGRESRVPIVIRPGDATRVVIDLQSQPPEVRVR